VLDDGRRVIGIAIELLDRSTGGDPKIDRMARPALERAVKVSPPSGQNLIDLSIYDDNDEDRAISARLRTVLAQAAGGS
jgi:hypothetical protein